ncbi:MAG TPA: hypothetical protein VGC56_03965 [Allosphingosinicella sp.]
MRAGKGRWSERTRGLFRAGLAETGNVRAAAALAGISTTALYRRRKLYPMTEAEWDAARETGCRNVSLLLIEAAEAALDPAIAAEAKANLPELSVADAIAVLRLHRFNEAGAPTHVGERNASRARGQAVEDMPIEAVRAEILRRVEAIRVHEAREEAEDDSEATVPEEEGQLHNFSRTEEAEDHAQIRAGLDRSSLHPLRPAAAAQPVPAFDMSPGHAEPPAPPSPSGDGEAE